MSLGDHGGYEYIFTKLNPIQPLLPFVDLWQGLKPWHWQGCPLNATGRAVPSMPLSPPTLAGWCASQGAGRQANHWVCGNGAGSSLKECLLAAQRRTCGLPGLGRKLFFSSSALQSSHFQEMTPPLEIPEPSLLPFPSCAIPSPSPAHTLQTRAPVSPCRSFSPWPQLPL